MGYEQIARAKAIENQNKKFMKTINPQQATQITCIILMKKMYLMSILMRRISLRLW